MKSHAGRYPCCRSLIFALCRSQWTWLGNEDDPVFLLFLSYLLLRTHLCLRDNDYFWSRRSEPRLRVNLCKLVFALDSTRELATERTYRRGAYRLTGSRSIGRRRSRGWFRRFGSKASKGGNEGIWTGYLKISFSSLLLEGGRTLCPAFNILSSTVALPSNSASSSVSSIRLKSSFSSKGLISTSHFPYLRWNERR
jgi:hypothetical protein